MELRLPIDVVTQMDMMRLQRELNRLEDFFASLANRQPGTQMRLPRLSRLLDQLARENGYNLLEPAQRKQLGAQVQLMLDKAPLIHISFAVDPPPQALQKILEWLRTNVHPQILLQVGLQPNIAVGCILRTSNRSFDMSLKQRLENEKKNLVGLIAGAAK